MESEHIVVGDTDAVEELPVLLEGRLLSLPDGAVQNPDGSVTLTLIAPTPLAYIEKGARVEARIETLLMRRLTGADLAKMRNAKDVTTAALALSLDYSPARLDLLLRVLDARDLGAAEEILGEFLNMSDAGGLPEQAEETETGVVLPMVERPATDEAGTVYPSFTFRFLTAAQMRQAKDAPDRLVWAVGLATGLTPKDAKAVLASMDGADAMAMSRVVRFLSTGGRKPGR